MTAVMIGVDPHKGSHTAVVIGPAEEPLGEIRVRASAAQAGKLVEWAAAWPERTWAVEGAAGLGRLLAQQLVAAGERVLDVQPKLASRVRLLQAGDTNKNDPNDALSVAVAALRSRTCRQVAAEDHPAVLKVWAKRHRDLARPVTRSPAGCTRCSATWSPAAYLQGDLRSSGRQDPRSRSPRPAPSALARAELAAEFLADLRRLDAQLRETKQEARRRGPGLRHHPHRGLRRRPGHRRHHHRRRRRRVPVPRPRSLRRLQRHRPGRGVLREPEDPPAVAAREPARQPRRSTWPRSPRSGTSTATAAPTTRRSWPRARRTKRRCGASSGRSATPSTPASRPTPARPQRPGQGPGRATGERL